MGISNLVSIFQVVLARKDKLPLILMLVALSLLAAPLDVFQLICAVAGALVYALFSTPMKTMKSPHGRVKEKSLKAKTIDDSHVTSSPLASTVAVSKPTAMPIKAPTFTASGFDSQVDEFIDFITPSTSCNRAVEALVSVIRAKIQILVPEVEILGFATGNLRGGTAYGVAVPDVDIVANVSPTDLMKRLQGRLSQMPRQRSITITRLDTRKLHKSAIRLCTSLLVSIGFKFRRSSFKSEEPKVTLLAPVALGASHVSIPIDFSINNTTPLYNMALLTECGHMDLRAKSLILLVKRWAKDRGICHASKGHLPPYAWSLLAIYYLQVGVAESDGGLPLPALDAFALSSGLIPPKGVGASSEVKRSAIRQAPTTAQKTMGELFRGFVRFYSREFDWCKEAVSVRLGKRASPSMSLEIHVVLNDDGTTAVSPVIEDPFDSKKNLGCCTNASSLRRFSDEMDRADRLLAQHISLTQLLEPWRPAEHEKQENDNEDDE